MKQIELVLRYVKYCRDISVFIFIIICFFITMLSAVFTLRYIISWITDKDSFLSIVHVLETSNFCNNKIFLRLTISAI